MFNRRILFFPVDERFCTRDYFLLMAQAAGIKVITPPKRFLGAKKTPPDLRRLLLWLEANAKSGDDLVLSIDMLVHGGLIPSRTSLDSIETLEERLSILKILKDRGCKIYATASITRTPFYNSSEEEPDYWQAYGQEIHAISRLIAKSFQSESISNQLIEKARHIPPVFLSDYLQRRARNRKLVSRTIDLVRQGVIEFLNLVLDDNSRESLSMEEGRLHQIMVTQLGIEEKVAIHAGADEAALSLLSRILAGSCDMIPEFEVHYAAEEHRMAVPPYEGSPLWMGIRSHVEAAGGRVVEGSGQIALLVNNGAQGLDSANQNKTETDPKPYARLLGRVNNPLPKIKSVADVKYTNGGDNHLVQELLRKQIFDWRVMSYAGWNTAGNTLGTCCAYAIIQYLGEKGFILLDEPSMKRVAVLFFLEHWAFQSNIRNDLIIQGQRKGVQPWTVIPIELWAEGYVQSAMEAYKPIIQQGLGIDFALESVFFPWHRSFEIGISVEV